MTWRETGTLLVLIFNDADPRLFPRHQPPLLRADGDWVLGDSLRVLREIQWHDDRRLMQSPFTPPVSIIATAYNEQANIVETVRSLLMVNYGEFEVIVINDGSHRPDARRA